MAWLCRVLVVCVLHGSVGHALAVRVQGIVRDANTRLPVQGALVGMERANARVTKSITRIDGHYRVEVRAGERTVIRFECTDRVPRHVVFDATDVPREWNDALEANMDMRLFRSMAGADSLMLYAPAGICTWDPAQENMAWDLDRSAPLTERWNALLEEHLLAHPDQRPSVPQRWGVALFDLSLEWGIFMALGLVWLIYFVSISVRKRVGRNLYMSFLLVMLAAGAWMAIVMRAETGPLRFVAFLGMMVGIMALARLVSEVLMGVGTAKEPDVLPDYRTGEQEEGSDLEFDEVAMKRGRYRGSVNMVLFFLAVFTFIFEGVRGAENTLDIWVLFGKGALPGLALAALVAWMRSPVVLRKYPGSLLWSGGVWWLVLPLLCMAGASCLNRSFLMQEVICHTWPVAEVSYNRKAINVWVAWDGERERLEMPRAIKERITTLDSLRCCTRTGLLGHDFVFHVEAVFDTGDRL